MPADTTLRSQLNQSERVRFSAQSVNPPKPVEPASLWHVLESWKTRSAGEHDAFDLILLVHGIDKRIYVDRHRVAERVVIDHDE